jgi:hypothetical protein
VRLDHLLSKEPFGSRVVVHLHPVVPVVGAGVGFVVVEALIEFLHGGCCPVGLVLPGLLSLVGGWVWKGWGGGWCVGVCALLGSQAFVVWGGVSCAGCSVGWLVGVSVLFENCIVDVSIFVDFVLLW